MAKHETDHPKNSERGRVPGAEPKPPLRMQYRHKLGHTDLMANPHGDGPVRKDVLVQNGEKKTY